MTGISLKLRVAPQAPPWAGEKGGDLAFIGPTSLKLSWHHWDKMHYTAAYSPGISLSISGAYCWPPWLSLSSRSPWKLGHGIDALKASALSQTKNFTSSGGKQRSVTEIVAQQVLFLGDGKSLSELEPEQGSVDYAVASDPSPFDDVPW